MLNWNSVWVSHGESQKGIFDYFFSGINPNKSIIFPYYKQVPFIEDNRRVIAGIGNIISKVNINEYNSDGSCNEKNYIWETNTPHSIRGNDNNGLLMPYLEIIEYLKENPYFDVSSVTVFEPSGFREEFSYTAEWVSYDAAIDVLNQFKIALNNIGELNLKKANKKWINEKLEYIDEQLKNVWNQRGIYLGLGSMLSAFGVKFGFDIAHYIDLEENDLISELKLYFEGDKEIVNSKLDDSLAEKEDEFNGILKDRNKIKYFELLSRINLSIEQSSYVWKEFKEKSAEIIENPYLLYEYTTKEKLERQITISQIDNAMFVNSLVENKHPLEKPTKMRTKSDKRRFRAMLVFVLHRALEKGHTLLTYNDAINLINKLPLDQKTDFETDKIEGIIEFLQDGYIYINRDEKYLKLKEYEEIKYIIRKIVDERLKSNIENSQNWHGIIENQFKELEKGNEERDRLARNEKSKALEIMESSKISVLLGRAGTGKTSALGIFASSNLIKQDKVLALTPTGKARVQLENSFRQNEVDASVMTVAQFLIKSKGFNWDTMTYKIPTESSTSIAQTVIIDESSMLTEEMFAGILKLVDTHAKRIIFTGDPNQLPPIGAGRPFVDLINYLEGKYPHKIARLNTEMRQGSGGDDLSFAQIFSNSYDIDKDIIYRIENNITDSRFKYIKYKDLEQLEEEFKKELIDITNMKDDEDIDSFNKSLGAIIDDYTNYKTSKNLENWQILSPTKFVGIGSYYLNNQIHKKYRQHIVDEWNGYKYSKSKPQSIQNLVYGDKIISNENGTRECWDAVIKTNSDEYIANGEIGIMSDYPGHYGKKDKNKNYYKFMFKSFEGKIFSYTKNEFGGENTDSKLELAYALTVHKSQGSSFGKTIVVINGKNSFITKELLYTAFSRQKNKLIILSDLSVEELVNYSNDWYSDTKQRYTDLFEKPDIIEIEYNNQKKYFEEKLIHKTIAGEMVRSKSELIIANILKALDLDYSYEEKINVNGKTYIPDFTIRHKGEVVYLEHLGMLSDKSYVEKWNKKKYDYEKEGITETNRKLIITEDGIDGGLNAEAIENKIVDWKNNI